MAQPRVKAGAPRKESVFGERFAVFAECLLTGVWIAVEHGAAAARVAGYTHGHHEPQS